MMELAWHDWVGSFGTLMVVSAYFGTQARLINSEDLAFPVVNLVGSVLIAVSLSYTFNLASALMEGFWILISLFGIWQALQAKRSR
ncbi:CBU_0592 family membrane protein [Pseudaestuariivita sp.]|uniref:CBU_0592 family membrane protein n=1 Tax=Pseudaestuariivita sp. TaxID=2211669 RepID=UPI0040599D93